MTSVTRSNCQVCSSLDHYFQNMLDFCTPNLYRTCYFAVGNLQFEDLSKVALYVCSVHGGEGGCVSASRRYHKYIGGYLEYIGDTLSTSGISWLHRGISWLHRGSLVHRRDITIHVGGVSWVHWAGGGRRAALITKFIERVLIWNKTLSCFTRYHGSFSSWNLGKLLIRADIMLKAHSQRGTYQTTVLITNLFTKVRHYLDDLILYLQSIRAFKKCSSISWQTVANLSFMALLRISEFWMSDIFAAILFYSSHWLLPDCMFIRKML